MPGRDLLGSSAAQVSPSLHLKVTSEKARLLDLLPILLGFAPVGKGLAGLWLQRKDIMKTFNSLNVHCFFAKAKVRLSLEEKAKGCRNVRTKSQEYVDAIQ